MNSKDAERLAKDHEHRDNEDEENFLHSKNLLKTPPNRNRKGKTKSATSLPSANSPLPLGDVINTPEYAGSPVHLQEEAACVVPDSFPDGVADKDADAEAEATFLTPQRRPVSSQVLVPETPVAEMGLTHVEKVTMARRRFREERAAIVD